MVGVGGKNRAGGGGEMNKSSLVKSLKTINARICSYGPEAF